MDYIKLLFADILMGYVLQSIGYALCIYAFNKRKIEIKSFALIVVIFSVVMFLIRKISVINFGIHTILIMIVFILISLGLLKTQIYSTVLGALVTTITIIVSEILNYSILTIILGAEKLNSMLKGVDGLKGDIDKAITGIPTNLILVTAMLILYHFMTINSRGGKKVGKSGKKDI